MWAPYRVLRIKRAAYRAAQEAANLGPVIGYQASPCIHVYEAHVYMYEAQTGTTQHAALWRLTLPFHQGGQC